MLCLVVQPDISSTPQQLPTSAPNYPATQMGALAPQPISLDLDEKVQIAGEPMPNFFLELDFIFLPPPPPPPPPVYESCSLPHLFSLLPHAPTFYWPISLCLDEKNTGEPPSLHLSIFLR